MHPALALPDQADVYRVVDSPAATGRIPAESEMDVDAPVVVPVPIGGKEAALVFGREDAIRFVLAERRIVLAGDNEAHAAERELCRRSRLWFVARWVDIESKFRVRGERTVPFVPFPYQARTIWLYDQARADARGIFEEKSRQLGFSWLWMAIYLHGLLFEARCPLYATSHKQDEVDDGGSKSTTDSLFGRMRFMYEALPDFLRLNPATGNEALSFKHLLVSHETSGSYITGEAATANIARGSSYVSGLLDEFAHIERSESAWASADDAIECPIVNSTPKGEDNKFADLRNKLARPRNETEAQVRERFLVQRTHWSEHPIYARGIERDADGKLTSPWYRRAISTKTPEKAAQEYDIEYGGSQPGRYFPEFSRGVHVPEEDIPLQRQSLLYLSADHGLSDTEVWGLWQTDGETFADLIDEWHSVPEGQHHGADLTSSEVAEGIVAWLNEWQLALRWLQGVVPDPSGAARDQTSGQSHHDLLWSVWRRMGQVVPEWIPAHNAFAEGVESTRLLLRGSWQGRPFRVRISPRCTLTIDSLQSYRRRVTREGQVLDSEHKDWSNHGADMVRYFCHTLFPAIGDDVAAPETETYVAAGARF